MGAPRRDRRHGQQLIDTGNGVVEEVLVVLEAARDSSAATETQDHVVLDRPAELENTLDEGKLTDKLKLLAERVHSLENLALAVVACGLANALYQLRAWYCEALGEFLLALLQAVLDHPQRLQQPPGETTDPTLAVCRLLEGVLLVCTVAHARSSVTAALEGLLKKRRIPPLAMTRLEAALMMLLQEAASEPLQSVPLALPLAAEVDGAELARRVELLHPRSDMREKLDDVKAVLCKVIAHVFPGHEPAYFGGAVNGFEISTSDVDCVVILRKDFVSELLEMAEESSSMNSTSRASSSPTAAGGDAGNTSERHQQKVAAAVAAKILAKALVEDEQLQDVGLTAKEVIADARVPILKCDSNAGISVDISFNNSLPLHNTKLLRAYADLDDRVGDLGRLVKHWAKRRGVNSVLEGTLSSYSHVLLTIHYLQRVGLVPNLQDKEVLSPGERSEAGCEELIGGIHDVWFWDPNKLHSGHPAVAFWVDNAPDHATLEGLLCGFFHYYAFEFPFYEEVVSIRLSGSLRKPDYFRAFLDSSAGDAEALPDAQAGEIEIIEEPGPVEDCAKDELTETDVGAPVDECGDSSQVLEAAPEEGMCREDEDTDTPKAPEKDGDSSPSKKHKLSRQEHRVQHIFGGRLTLCIDDPMERGRTLGTSFQGAERLWYELRRACELLRDGCSKEALDELFLETPPKSLWKLVEKRQFSGILDGEKRIVRTLQVPPRQAGAVLGVKGAVIQEMRQIKGITSATFSDGAGKGENGTLRVTGEAGAVQQCIAQAQVLLAEASADSSSSSRWNHAKSESAKASAAKGQGRRGEVGKGSSIAAGVARAGAGMATGTAASNGWRWSEHSWQDGGKKAWWPQEEAQTRGNDTWQRTWREQGKGASQRTWRPSGSTPASTPSGWSRSKGGQSGKGRRAW